jgi:hypothetical protein
MVIFTYRTLTDGSIDKSHFIQIPDSASDPGLRTVNTGYRWWYENANVFILTVTRPEVVLTAVGMNQGSDRRRYQSILQKTTSSTGCVSGNAWDSIGGPTSGGGCGPMGSITSLPTVDFRGWIGAEACSDRCLAAHVPEPQ